MTQPLRPTDPRTLGAYDLLSRLGEGGMGTVYLGRAPSGQLVAVKVIRAEHAPDDEFRRRFRSEVTRARQVPPFCTAEVLDADPDHEQPYLVVEYVDGPSLTEVVGRQGPLSTGSLHSVAIGVATALTAIHGAGVIHRDLKPGNVLFGLGSPKVIDFGIARAMELTSQHTRTDQMVGTVAYMAPERFDSQSRAVTSAADIFAWGAVVMYAGTGRTPFAADSPPATAARILTQPPDLTGLSGPLRDLVGLSLAKNPDDRPTARELLDMLLTAGPQGAPMFATGLDERPALRRAAEAAHATSRQSTGDQAGHPRPHFATTGQTPAPPFQGRPVQGQPFQGRPVQRPPIPGPRRQWPKRLGVVAAVLGVLVGLTVPVGLGAAVGSALSSEPEVVVTVDRGGQQDPGATAEDEPGGRPDEPPASPPPVPADGEEVITDALTEPGNWVVREDAVETSSCVFYGALVVVRRDPGSYRCPGPRLELTSEQRITVDVTVDSPDTCAAVWFLFSGTSGYQVRACTDSVMLGTHKGAEVTKLDTFGLDTPFETGVRRRLGIEVRDRIARLSIDGTALGRVPLSDKSLTEGRVVLGIHTDARDGDDHQVTFTAIQMVTFE